VKNAEEFWVNLKKQMLSNSKVIEGKMMSSDALKYKSKVFVFFWKDQLGCKLGKAYDLKTLGISKWEYLSPFKSKPPMKSWYMIDQEHADQWLNISKRALGQLERELE